MIKNLKKLAAIFTLGCLTFSLNAATPSPAMMAQFNKLPKSEQAKLARQYGLKLSDMKSSSTAKDASDLDEDVIVKPYQDAELRSAEKQLEPKTEGPQRFGLSFFVKSRQKDELNTGAPVPDQYLLGPDDELLLQVYGVNPIDAELKVARDGTVAIEDIGVVSIAGLTFSEARTVITERIQAANVGADVNVSMGKLRTISVIVAGEAKRPGAYTVPALSSVVDVLTLAGGVSDIGALRRIQLKQKDGASYPIDLYRLLLGGDSGVDRQLHNGDVVFIAPYHALAEVAGEVLRPALYEIEPNESVSDLLKMAGGGNAQAYIGAVTLERIDNSHVRSLVNLDLSVQNDTKMLVQNGDVLRFGKVSAQLKNKIDIIGAAARPGSYAFNPGMRVNNLISSVWKDLTINTDLDYALVVSRVGSGNRFAVKQFNLGEAIDNPQSASNLELKAQDTVYIFSYDTPLLRKEVDEYLFEQYEKELAAAAEMGELSDEFIVQRSESPELQIKSLVSKSGFANLAFALLKDADSKSNSDRRVLGESFDLGKMSELDQSLPSSHHKLVAKLMRELLSDPHRDPKSQQLTAGLNRQELLYGLLQQLKTSSSGVSSHSVMYVSGEVRAPGEYPLAEGASVQHLVAAAGGLLPSAFLEHAELTRANISEKGAVQIEHLNVALFDELQQNTKTLLQSRDQLNVFRYTDWDVEQRVTLAGQIRFPGEYTVRSGETLADILKRAGGLTQNAFPEGAIMIRDQVKAQEVEQMTKLTQQLRRDIAARTLSAESAALSTQDALVMLTEIEKVKPVGRLVVDVQAVIDGKGDDDFVLENGDYLMIPTRKTTVSVVGEVQHPSSHRFKAGLSIDDYLRLAGGSRKRADDERIYIIRADGSVLVPQSNSWFEVSEQDMRPGDTIVVPLDTEFKDNMTLWTQVTQIFYQSAVALAAINSF